VLATRFGAAAVAAVHDGAFDTMVALKDGEIVRVPIADATETPKTVDLDLVDVAAALTG
jgi:6-phosphofructokinase 1